MEDGTGRHERDVEFDDLPCGSRLWVTHREYRSPKRRTSLVQGAMRRPQPTACDGTVRSSTRRTEKIDFVALAVEFLHKRQKIEVVAVFNFNKKLQGHVANEICFLLERKIENSSVIWIIGRRRPEYGSARLLRLLGPQL